WRYSPGQAGDTSVTSWVVTALKTGQEGGLDVPAATVKKATSYLDTVLDDTTEGYGYTGPQPMPSMTAAALLSRQNLEGWDAQNPPLIRGVDNYLKKNSPRETKKDIYYYYYATQVVHRLGGTEWQAWNDKMRDMIVKSQEKEEAFPTTDGSWSPQGDN